MCWKTYVLSRSKVEVIAPFTMDMHRKKVSTYLTHAGQCATNCNGNGGETYPLKNVVCKGRSGETQKKVSLMSPKGRRR